MTTSDDQADGRAVDADTASPNAPASADQAPPSAPASAAERPPRVLMLGLGWFPDSLGGLERYFRCLFEQLPEASAVTIGPATDAPASLTVAGDRDAPLARRLLAYRRAALRAGANADVLDAHFALYAGPALLLGPLRRRPSVFHFHGPWAQENVAAGDASGAKLRLRSRVERAVLRRADAHVVLSSAFRRVLVERYGVSPWNVRVIAPGVALEQFTPGERSQARARIGAEPSAFVAVCVRRLVPRMGLELLLDAWGELRGELPAGSLLLVIGDGPLRAELSERAAAPALAGSVRVLGRVDDGALVDAYRCADVALVPSLAVEGYGLVVLEAAACGTPSIVSDVGGLPEAAAALDPSLVIAGGDGAALRERLRGAARGELPDREATRRYAERFTWHAAAERHRELYRRVARGQRADERPRVVYLDHVARLSGGEIALLRLLPHLSGVNAHVILAEDGPFAARLAQAGVSVEVLAMAATARDTRRDSVRLGATTPAVGAQTLAYVARLTHRLRRLKPDVVHANSLKSGVYGALAAKAARVPMVWHVRDRISDDYLPAPAVRLVRGLVRNLADGAIANSQATLDTLSAPRPGRPHCVIPDSVELSSRPRAERVGSVTFGMLGRIAPWKGQDLFLRAFAAAFADGQERAVLVGTAMFGEQDYERELRELAARLGLDGRVEFRGFREDVWSELAAFDVLVHASVIPEPFGQVVLEGMAAGLPVIAPDEGGPASMIADGETGVLFASRDAERLAAAMRALAASPAERERLGAAARLALDEYRPSVLAARYEHLYAQLSRPHAGRTRA